MIGFMYIHKKTILTKLNASPKKIFFKFQGQIVPCLKMCSVSNEVFV